MCIWLDLVDGSGQFRVGLGSLRVSDQVRVRFVIFQVLFSIKITSYDNIESGWFGSVSSCLGEIRVDQCRSQIGSFWVGPVLPGLDLAYLEDYGFAHNGSSRYVICWVGPIWVWLIPES